MAPNRVGGPGSTPPSNLVHLRPLARTGGQQPAYLRRNLRVVRTVLDLLKASSWLSRPWQTQETSFAFEELSKDKTFEASLRERYQDYAQTLKAGFDLLLPHYYFKSKAPVTGRFLDEVLSGRLTTDMHDVRGNYIIMRSVPSYATGMWPSQKEVPYEVALTRDIEDYGNSQSFHLEERYPGKPYNIVHFHNAMRIADRFIPHVVKAVIFSLEDGGNPTLAREKVAASGLPIPVISDREAILEAELLYRAALKYDFPTLLREGRAVLTSIAVQEIASEQANSHFFWSNFLDRLQPGEIVGINQRLWGDKPAKFELATWGMVFQEGDRKKVLALSETHPRENPALTISLTEKPEHFTKMRFPHYTSVHVFSLRRTGVVMDPARVSAMGLAEALAEREPGVELII